MSARKVSRSAEATDLVYDHDAPADAVPKKATKKKAPKKKAPRRITEQKRSERLEKLKHDIRARREAWQFSTLPQLVVSVNATAAPRCILVVGGPREYAILPVQIHAESIDGDPNWHHHTHPAEPLGEYVDGVAAMRAAEALAEQEYPGAGREWIFGTSLLRVREDGDVRWMSCIAKAAQGPKPWHVLHLIGRRDRPLFQHHRHVVVGDFDDWHEATDAADRIPAGFDDPACTCTAGDS